MAGLGLPLPLSLDQFAVESGFVPPAARPASHLGLEHEYRVLAGARAVDFRDLIHALPIAGRRLDPGDANAYRCASGLAITADDEEAEVATPPVAVAPGFTSAIEAWAASARRELLSALPGELRLEGFSTHLSASFEGEGDAAAALYARTFGPALAMLLEAPTSLGIYVRPRPGRLELCGEFADGARLGAVAAFVAGSVRACASVLDGNGQTLPPPVRVATRPGVERYGLRILRNAWGVDLYRDGRAAQLTLESGGMISAQEHLERAVAAAIKALGADASPGDVHVLGEIATGERRLGVEGDAREDEIILGESPASVLGEATRERRHNGIALSPFAATWDFTLYRLRLDGARRVVSIPRSHLGWFVEAFDGGGLDGWLARAAAVENLPALELPEQTRTPGLFSGVPDVAALLPSERPGEGESPAEDPLVRAGKRGVPPGRRAKRRFKAAWPMIAPTPLQKATGGPPVPLPPDRPTEPAPLPGAPGRPWHGRGIAIVGAIAAGVLAIGAAAAWLAGDGSAGAADHPTPSPTATSRATASNGGAPPLTETPGAIAADSTPLPQTPVPTDTPASKTPTPGDATSGTTATPAGATATSTATATPHPTDAPPPTLTVTPQPTETPRPVATATPSPMPHPTDVPPPTIAPTKAPTPTTRPTETPRPAPTATPTCISKPGAATC